MNHYQNEVWLLIYSSKNGTKIKKYWCQWNDFQHKYTCVLHCTCLLAHLLTHSFTHSPIHPLMDQKKKKILPDLGRAKVVGLGWVEGETKIHIIYKVNNRHEYYATQSKSKIQTILLLNITLPSIFWIFPI